MKSSLSLLLSTLLPLLVAVQVTAHGYVASPPSRAAICRAESSPTSCGAIQYEPQSVEAVKGLPFTRNDDGHLCSASVTRFSQLDRQGSSAWKHQKPLDAFTWNILVPHSTTDFKYFITKDGWNSDKSDGLRASDLEPTPFHQVKMNGKEPDRSTTHKVDHMPNKSGYHVVYAVWTIADTTNAFYQCIDLDFGGSGKGGSVASTGGGNHHGASNGSNSNDSSTSAKSSNASTHGHGKASASKGRQRFTASHASTKKAHCRRRRSTGTGSSSSEKRLTMAKAKRSPAMRAVDGAADSKA